MSYPAKSSVELQSLYHSPIGDGMPRFTGTVSVEGESHEFEVRVLTTLVENGADMIWADSDHENPENGTRWLYLWAKTVNQQHEPVVLGIVLQVAWAAMWDAVAAARAAGAFKN